jgi:hypothetical protein
MPTAQVLAAACWMPARLPAELNENRFKSDVRSSHRRTATGGSGRRDASSTRGIIDRMTDPTAAYETRIDRWLCAVRLVRRGCARAATSS